jgi:hypothetical protein
MIKSWSDEMGGFQLSDKTKQVKRTLSTILKREIEDKVLFYLSLYISK